MDAGLKVLIGHILHRNRPLQHGTDKDRQKDGKEKEEEISGHWITLSK
jgi:hypothetical protein